jgi:DNA-binding transcriptional LysR family regulator
MELSDLEAFRLVVDHGGFNRAAEVLCLTQPAVTRKVKALEREFNTRLLDRMGKKVATTTTGLGLFIYAHKFQMLQDEMTAMLEDLKCGLTGRLRVGASSTAATYFLPNYLSRYKAKYPRMELQVQTGVSAQVVERVLKNEVDIGIVMDFAGHPMLEEQVWRTYQMLLVVYPSHALVQAKEAGGASVKSLEGQSLVVMEQGTNLRGIVDRLLEETGVSVEISLELDSVEAIKKMVEAKLGIALLPEVAIEEEVGGGRLVALELSDAPAMQRGVSLIYRKDKYLSGAISFFMDILLGRDRLELFEGGGRLYDELRSFISPEAK